MKAVAHHIVLGSGTAGLAAATALRDAAPEDRVTIITASRMLPYHGYSLSMLLEGVSDWKKVVAHVPAFFEERRIGVRRDCRVVNVDPKRQIVGLYHKEEVHFDTLIVASGSRANIPEDLADYADLLQRASNYEQTLELRRALPPGGHAVVLGCDVTGIAAAKALRRAGDRVTMVVGTHAFWPHKVDEKDRPRFLSSLERMGISVVDEASRGGIASIAEGGSGRTVHFHDKSSLDCHVVVPFYGLTPVVEPLVRAGVDIERGVLVGRDLKTSADRVYAAGNVCQLRMDDGGRSRFFYGWRNARAMAERAACNALGASEPFVPVHDEDLVLDEERLISPFWHASSAAEVVS